MSLSMAQLDVGTSISAEVAASQGRFPCPSCGSLLRNGAILCPHCDADLWKLTHGDPEPSSEPVLQPMEAEPSAGATFPDRRAVLSLIIAVIAMAAKIVLPLVATRAPASSLFLTVSAWGTTLLAVYAVHLARQAERPIDSIRDQQELRMAKYGLIIGMATIAYVVSVFVTSSIDQVISSLQH